MCINCTSYNSKRTKQGNTFTNGKLSFRVYEGNEDDDDYILYYYICNKGNWILKYPNISYIPEDLRDAVQQANYKDISEQLRDCKNYRLHFLMKC